MTQEEKIDAIAEHYKAILQLIGEDPHREGLLKTPRRAAKALLHATQGYSQDADDIVNGALFSHPGTGVVSVDDIEFYSMCEHHILPFFGTVSIAYIPHGKILGLSKLARIVDMYARRLQVQERMTWEIAQAVSRVAQTPDVKVEIKAGHLCMKMRGVEKQQSVTRTVEVLGTFSKPVVEN